MDKIRFIDNDTDEVEELYVLEETTVSEKKYLLVAKECEGDSDAYIFRYMGENENEVTYSEVVDDTEYAAVLKVFEELMEDSEFVSE